MKTDNELEELRTKTNEIEKEAKSEVAETKEIFLVIITLIIIVITTYTVLVYGNISKVGVMFSNIAEYIKTLV